MAKIEMQGFTLAELLIALAILGEIATFTIPKIISAQQNGTKTAVIKETVATLNQALYLGVQLGEINDSNFDTYLPSKVNTLKICPTNATSDGCVTAPVAHTNFANYKGFIMSNGALVTCGNNAGAFIGYRECFIDWNGPGSPNLINEDQFVVFLYYNNAGGKPGQLKNHSGWTSDTVWASFFQ